MRDLKKRQNSPKDHAGLFEAQHHWTHYRRCVCPLNEKHSDPARPEDMEDVSRKDAETFGRRLPGDSEDKNETRRKRSYMEAVHALGPTLANRVQRAAVVDYLHVVLAIESRGILEIEISRGPVTKELGERKTLIRLRIATTGTGPSRRNRCGRWPSCVRLMFGVLVFSVAMITQAQSATEYQVKAAFLFNFAKFVEWPAEAFSSGDAPLQICVWGQDPFGRDFEQVVADKAVNGHRIEIVHPEGIPQARACQVLFISSDKKNQVQQVLLGLKGASVLTVGDADDFAQLGGAIGFVLDEGRVRFVINQKAAEQSRLRLSARLLTVAKAVVAGD